METLNKLIESALPDEDTGMFYKSKRGNIEDVKKVGNKFYAYDNSQNRWFPIKKADVQFKEDKKVNESVSGLLTFNESLFVSIVESQNKPQILPSYVKRVIKSEKDIQKIEVYTQKTDNVYLVLKINGKDVFFNEVDDIKKINASKDTFIKQAKLLFKDFNSKNEFKFDVDKLDFDVEKYFTASKVIIK